jgi:hypothetical protein
MSGQHEHQADDVPAEYVNEPPTPLPYAPREPPRLPWEQKDNTELLCAAGVSLLAGIFIGMNVDKKLKEEIEYNKFIAASAKESLRSARDELRVANEQTNYWRDRAKALAEELAQLKAQYAKDE